VTMGLASRTLSEGVVQLLPAVFIFRTVLLVLVQKIACSVKTCTTAILPTTDPTMDCPGIESALLCTIQAKRSVTAHCSLCVVELLSIRDGAEFSVVFLGHPRKTWKASRSEATTAAPHITRRCAQHSPRVASTHNSGFSL
jgi:hypothetical protein